jgi:hypothetical protein
LTGAGGRLDDVRMEDRPRELRLFELQRLLPREPAAEGVVRGLEGARWRVIGNLVLLAFAGWAFAATFEPEQSWSFGRPVSPSLIVVVRVLAAVLVIGLLLLLILDFVRKKGSGPGVGPK